MSGRASGSGNGTTTRITLAVGLTWSFCRLPPGPAEISRRAQSALRAGQLRVSRDFFPRRVVVPGATVPRWKDNETDRRRKRWSFGRAGRCPHPGHPAPPSSYTPRGCFAFGLADPRKGDAPP
ncbi:hypothetical protein GCM10010423_58030 [Streptomyces levis]|uniref:Uncharacterized protein n=1 Tax=Streptomyces levis TaxID=285566 RepID=A0ABN3P087_9ACTN